MKKKLTHNLGLKVLALICATCLWLIAVNINDPVTQRAYTVPVRLENLTALTNAGKYVEIMDGTDTVRVTVRASRSVFADFNEKNLSATADVLKLTEDNKIPIQVSSTKIDSKIETVKADKEFVSISMENMMKLQKRISVNVLKEPADGYVLGNISTDQNAVIVSGPESVVSQIETTAVEINVAEATNDVNITLPVHLYDADGNEIKDSRLTKSISEVFTTAVVLQKKEVPLEFRTKGEVAEGYLFTDVYEQSVDTVEVAAKPAVLKNFNSILVDDPIDLTAAEADVTAQFEIKQYLPEGIVLVDNKDGGVVSVTAKIQERQQKKLRVDEDRIELVNVPDGYEASLKGLSGMDEVILSGMEEELAEITSYNLNGKIDVKKILEREENNKDFSGNYYVAPDFELPEHVEVFKNVKIHFLLEKK